MTTPSLFSDLIAAALPAEPPSVRGSDTSVAAAKQIEPITGALRLAVYAMLVSRGWVGATDEEMQDALEMAPNTQRPRRIELVEDGWVRDSGRTRPTRSGRKAVVWVVARTETR